MRYFKFTRVIGVKKNKLKRKHICSRDKEAGNLYDLFHTRDRLHRRAYQHKVTKNVEIMIKDALLKANNLIQFKGRDGEFTISDAKNDMEAYIQLTDQVTERILGSSSPELEQAKNILERIMRRDLYKLVGEAKGQNKQHKKISKKKITNKLKAVLPRGVKGHHNDYFEVVPVTYSYGKGDKDPVECSYFYKKDEPQKAFKISKQQVSNFLPECFLEQTIRLYWKNKDEDKEEDKKQLKDVAEKFKVWCKDNGFQVDIYPHQPPQDEAQHQEPSTKRQKRKQS
ncbi:deoxynucleoside triphosphate triphosphohydrolase SAMHD1-like [Oryzias latipes]|uniref:deoxynucleoside triphosphate triphosphohydrolase SAMHD1-like n=1 Tax=Oryzias latipes TaxID=8090 RepID=UPI0005CC5260|nr:deoxynucleoside triphosphate triphosphohydrolase SAMHD1-like [Oryzias latipes]